MDPEVVLCDVGPRDGLQNEPEHVPAAVRAELVSRLAATGLRSVEAASFVRDDRVPRMAGAEEVCAAATVPPGVSLAGLVLNRAGYARLLETRCDEVRGVACVSETFNQRNQRRSVEQSLEEVGQIAVDAAARGLTASVTLAVAFGCPFEGAVDPGRVIEHSRRLVDHGVERIILADTIGVAVPSQVRRLVTDVRATGAVTGLHLHNTRNTGYANALAGLESGAVVLDASTAGIGGCPFAPRATGNVATEDLVYLLHGEGVRTGVDLDALLEVSQWLTGVMGRDLPGQLLRAGRFGAVA